MYCRNCGKQIDDNAKICYLCGVPTDGKQNQNGQQQYQQPYNQQNNVGSSDNTKVFSILAYIGILFLVGLIAAPNNQKVKFHVNQGLILFLFEIILNIAVGIIKGVFRFTHIFFFFNSTMLGLAQAAIIITLIIIGIVNASNGEEKQLPVIGNFIIIK